MSTITETIAPVAPISLVVEKTAIVGLEGFPSVVPALKINAGLAGIFACGDVYTGSTLFGEPLAWGSIESVGDFEPKLNFKKVHGQDWFRIDNDKRHGRFSVSAMATDEEGRSIRMIAEGVIELNEHVMPLIMGDPSAKTNPHGFGVEHLTFQSGHEIYKPLEGMMFACSQRFVKPDGEGQLPQVQISASRILPGSGFA